MAVPALNPPFAPVIVCPTCSNLIQPEVQKANNKKLIEVRYYCVNEPTNCAWMLTLSQQHILGDMDQMKPKEVEERREQQKQLAAFDTARDANLRELAALLPRLRLLAKAFAEDEPEPPELPPPAEAPVPPAVEPPPETVHPPVAAETGVSA